MTFSEPYMFVLAISAVLSIPLVLAIRTLLNPFKQGGHHGDSRTVDGEKLSEH